ncbi:helix-turn-helix transcriptional regulator [Paenibacillus sp. IB182496]|uniref:Helix-turn-helix transcriptional regulator n=1 Tax=Paenibacillus sabuli TaxID=2772509 RepID=A0A927GT47_9BACL|nr:helix-turn-helix transcriptional regulator [Paenibacillus sabuli]MBD2846961.1 helix-turn-helix transcriptional regulator [Paenibacillus sabuli]
MTMGDRLREQRLRMRMSQEEVARRIGVTRSAYSHYEINNRQPVYETLIKLSRLFEVSLDYIIGGDHDRRRQGEPVRGDTAEMLRLLNRMDAEKRKRSIAKLLKMLQQAE